MGCRRKRACRSSPVLQLEDDVPIAKLEYDVMFEILIRMSLTDVFKERSVSKLWLSLLCNPVFLSCWMSINKFKPWTTLIHDSSLSIDEYLTISSPNSYSQFISDHDGCSFNFLKLKAPQEKLYILSSCHGLVLCTPTKSCHTKFYVCNPLMKTWVLLPSRPQTFKKVVLAGLICETSLPSSTSSSFKVVCIPQFATPKRNFSLEIFISELRKWIIFEVSCTQEVTMPKHFGSRSNIIQHNGVLYWIEGRENRIIALDLNKGQDSAKLILLPKEVQKSGERLLAELDGSVVCFHGDQNRLNGWVLEGESNQSGRVIEDDINNGWICHSDYIPKYEHYNNGFLRPLSFDPVTRSIVILHSDPKITISIYSVKTRKLLHSVVAAEYDYKSFDSLKAFVFIPFPTPLSLDLSSIEPSVPNKKRKRRKQLRK